MGLLQIIKKLFTGREQQDALKRKEITIDTYASIASLFNKKELKCINEINVKGPARSGKGDELFDFIKQICIKYERLETLNMSGVVGLSEIKDEALKDCTCIKEIILPNGVLKIGTESFMNCSNLEKIFLPEGLERISESALAYCPKISNITFPKSLFRIGKDTLKGDDSLTRITIPSKVESIGTGALFCKNLKEIVVEPHNPSYISIDNVLYSRNGSALIIYPIGKTETEFVIPDHVAKVGEYVFNGTNLKNVIISKSVNIIGKYAFLGCDEITRIEIPSNVERIDEGAFMNCKNLENIKISAGVNSIGNFVFKGCSKLEDIQLPQTIMKIGDEAFAYCTSLKELVIPTTVEYFGENITKGSPADN